ncbi:MAG: hypothetical protein J3Q66DRAFT_405306 [Benniella sp.]|nr:MAG: hypothetical protein J3Q66DRAFT_405306 [Benniella sp.]
MSIPVPDHSPREGDQIADHGNPAGSNPELYPTSWLSPLSDPFQPDITLPVHSMALDQLMHIQLSIGSGGPSILTGAVDDEHPSPSFLQHQHSFERLTTQPYQSPPPDLQQEYTMDQPPRIQTGYLRQEIPHTSQALPLSQQQFLYQHSAPIHHDLQQSAQPWMSVEDQTRLHQSIYQDGQIGSPQWTPELSPSSPHGCPPSIFQTEHNLGQELQDVEIRVKRSHRRYTEDEKTAMRELHRNNPEMSYNTIGEIFGCSKSTAYRIINNKDDSSDSMTG